MSSKTYEKIKVARIFKKSLHKPLEEEKTAKSRYGLDCYLNISEK